MDWPSLSPDLNPMENVWAILVRRVYAGGRQFHDVETLKETIFREWNNLSLNDLNPFSSSMPNRIFEVIHLLENNPRLGRVVAELQAQSIREMIIGKYRLLYQIGKDDNIEIVTIRHSSRPLNY